MSVLPVGIGPETSYNISRSLRFNSADTAYLNRTPASAGNRKTWTWSGWFKRSGQLGGIFTSISGVNFTQLTGDGDKLVFVHYPSTTAAALDTVAVFRDYSAWYHIVLAVDTTQATDTNRVKIYINNQIQTLTQRAGYTSGYPSQNTDTFVNATQQHELNRSNSGGAFSGYLTEVNFIDGQALTPSSFGETDLITGVWKPKKYTGTYGTNGFYLNFSDNSGTTATTLGKDYSGNGNNWTPNNFSVTAGAGNDSLLDTPTQYGTDTGAGGQVGGNYATLNPLRFFTNTPTYANGNLDVSATSNLGYNAVSTMSTGTSGKWYFEITVNTSGGSATEAIGATDASKVYANSLWVNPGGYRSNGTIQNLAGTTQTAGSTYTSGDVIGVAIDVDNGTVKFYKNGVGQGGTPSYSFTAGTELWPFIAIDAVAATRSYTANFGQRPFAYTAPSGFKALCTTNLP